MQAPKTETKMLHTLNPLTPPTPKNPSTKPPITAPRIPTIIFANIPILPSAFIMILAIQPDNAPITNHDNNPITLYLALFDLLIDINYYNYNCLIFKTAMP